MGKAWPQSRDLIFVRVIGAIKARRDFFLIKNDSGDSENRLKGARGNIRRLVEGCCYSKSWERLGHIGQGKDPMDGMR